MQRAEQHKPRIAVSACLLGQPVRFDGGHKRDRFVTDQLSRLVEFQPVCPEMEAGLGVPRPTIQLRRIAGQVRLVQSNDASVDLTERMTGIAVARARQLNGRVSGLIVQKKSPSCGMERVPVSNGPGKPSERNGVGLFVQHFSRHAPLIPIEEEGRLNDPLLRENFLERVYSLDRWYRLEPDDLRGFIEFHAQHKLLLMARGSEAYRRLGRIVAGVERRTLAERRHCYIELFMQTLKSRVTRGHHYNVLQHIMGYFKRHLSAEDKRELVQLFDDYKAALVPLATPVMLISHHLRKHPDAYLESQHYLKPYPDALALRAVV
ncbi:MAG: DUF523 and DUF1722 domain-containing protein [Gammaproteobacteria bacterium]|nr:DUF523 and DUF1722 domain-containing protein [Gammaproteobacteria bacterium]